jgi:hypothetical protein
MPFLKVQDTITITASGGSFTLDTTASTEIYNIIGTATMISNVTIAPLGTPVLGLTYVFNYKAVLDITTNSTSITIFGQTLTDQQALNSQVIICSYNGTTWDVDIQSSFDDSNIVSTSNIENNAITSSKIASGAISTSSLADDSVTNAKLATMTVSSVKIGGSTGNPADLALGNNEIPIGNGTTVTTYDLSTLFEGAGLMEAIPVSISFEVGEQSLYRYYTGYPCKLHAVAGITTKALAATDNGVMTVVVNGSNAIPSSVEGTFFFPAGASANFQTAVHWTTHPTMLTTGYIDIIPSKATPGGKAIMTILIERI